MSGEGNLYSRFFGSRFAADAIRACLSEAHVARIATAFFEPSGWELLSPSLVGKDVRILVGRGEGAADKLDDLLGGIFCRN